MPWSIASPENTIRPSPASAPAAAPHHGAIIIHEARARRRRCGFAQRERSEQIRFRSRGGGSDMLRNGGGVGFLGVGWGNAGQESYGRDHSRGRMAARDLPGSSQMYAYFFRQHRADARSASSMSRPSTSFLLQRSKDVDARDKPGHDDNNNPHALPRS